MTNKKTQIVTTLQTRIVIKLQTQKTLITTKVKNKSFAKIQKHKLCQNSKNLILTIQILRKNFFFTQSFGKNNLTPQQPMRCILAKKNLTFYLV